MLNLEKVNIEQLIFLSEKLTGKPVKFRRGPATVNGEFLPQPLRRLGKGAINEEPKPGDLTARML